MTCNCGTTGINHVCSQSRGTIKCKTEQSESSTMRLDPWLNTCWQRTTDTPGETLVPESQVRHAKNIKENLKDSLTLVTSHRISLNVKPRLILQSSGKQDCCWNRMFFFWMFLAEVSVPHLRLMDVDGCRTICPLQLDAFKFSLSRTLLRTTTSNGFKESQSEPIDGRIGEFSCVLRAFESRDSVVPKLYSKSKHSEPSEMRRCGFDDVCSRRTASCMINCVLDSKNERSTFTNCNAVRKSKTALFPFAWNFAFIVQRLAV